MVLLGMGFASKLEPLPVNMYAIEKDTACFSFYFLPSKNARVLQIMGRRRSLSIRKELGNPTCNL